VRCRQQFTHAPEVVLDHIEVDHQAGSFGLLLAEITKNTLGHRKGFPNQKISIHRTTKAKSNATHGTFSGGARQPILDKGHFLPMRIS